MTGPAIHIGTFDPGTEEWHAARANGVGGSEVAAILGVSPFESRFSLFHRKAGTIGPVVENDAMRCGKLLEPVIRDVFRADHPDIPIVEAGTWRSVARPWQIANPDGIGDGCVWEGKYSLFGDEYGEPGSDEIPVHHRCQVLHYLDVFELPVAHLTVFVGGRAEFRHYRIEYSADEAALMRAECEKFLAEVAAGTPPPLDGSVATYDAVQELHPDLDGHDIDLTAAVAVPYLRALAEFADATTEKRRTAAEVITAMGSAQHARYSGERIASRIAKGDSPPHLRAANGASNLFREATAV